MFDNSCPGIEKKINLYYLTFSWELQYILHCSTLHLVYRSSIQTFFVLCRKLWLQLQAERVITECVKFAGYGRETFLEKTRSSTLVRYSMQLTWGCGWLYKTKGLVCVEKFVSERCVGIVLCGMCCVAYTTDIQSSCCGFLPPD
jgi:hypothetical protein